MIKWKFFTKLQNDIFALLIENVDLNHGGEKTEKLETTEDDELEILEIETPFHVNLKKAGKSDHIDHTINKDTYDWTPNNKIKAGRLVTMNVVSSIDRAEGVVKRVDINFHVNSSDMTDTAIKFLKDKYPDIKFDINFTSNDEYNNSEMVTGTIHSEKENETE